MNARFAWLWMVLGAWLLVAVAVPVPAQAQDRGKSAQGQRKKPQRKGAKGAHGKAAKVSPEAVQPSAAQAPAPAEEKAAHNGAHPAASEGDVHKEGGTDVKVLEFSGLDIEGQLKTPQMLYFLRRLRAEFGRPDLPHRSFLPELEQTTKDEAF